MSKMFFICLSHRPLSTSISESPPPASFASASVFTLFACAAVFLFHRFFFALTQFLICGISFFFDISNHLLVSFFELSFFFPVFCQCVSVCSFFLVSSLSLFVLREPSFFGVVITNVAMTHLWSLPMWIMSLASVSLLYFKCLLLIMM